jgi:surface antigen
MLSFDDRSRNTFNPISSQEAGQAAPFTEPLTQNDGFTPLPSTSDATNILPVQAPSFLPMIADPQTPLPASNVTRMLSGALDGSGDMSRAPVIIRGNMKRPVTPPQMPHPRRRKVTSLVGILVLFMIISFSLLIVTPLGQTVGLSINPSASNMHVVGSLNSNNTLNSVVAQATATAVYNNQQADGYDPYASTGVIIGSGNSPRPWPYGQCTYWANSYYHQLTGWWVNWAGNADQWVAGANAAPGWNVSTVPHVPSIMVLMPGVQGASYAYGHVAVVTSVIDSSTVMTSNMNWWANGGGWGIVSNVEFNYGPGYGVYFLWHS